MQESRLLSCKIGRTRKNSNHQPAGSHKQVPGTTGRWAEGTLKTLKREQAPSCGHFWSSNRELGQVSVFCSNSVSGLQQSRKKKKNPESSVVSGGFPRWLSGKESAYNTGDVDSIPGSGTLEKEMATCSSILAWEILMDRGAWQATVPSHKESDTTKQLNSLKTRNN